MIDLREILLAGHTQLRKEHQEKEAGRDSYRVGSSGCVVGEDIYGTCHRIAHLRSKKLEPTPSLGTEIMWKAGEANEYTWDRILKAAQRSGKLTAEIDTQVETVIQFEGVSKITEGHPDVILREGEEIGIELKGIFGWSAVELAWIKHSPKPDNAIQSAAYMIGRGLNEYILAYTCHHYPKVPHWDKKKIADRLQDEFGHNWMDPFYSIFYLRWHNEKLEYRHEYETKWVPTEITSKGIADYYRLLDLIEESKDLGPRPTSHYLDGSENKWGKESNCGLCVFKSACDNWDLNKDYEGWLNMVKEKLNDS